MALWRRLMGRYKADSLRLHRKRVIGLKVLVSFRLNLVRTCAQCRAAPQEFLGRTPIRPSPGPARRNENARKPPQRRIPQSSDHRAAVDSARRRNTRLRARRCAGFDHTGRYMRHAFGSGGANASAAATAVDARTRTSRSGVVGANVTTARCPGKFGSGRTAECRG